MSRQDDHQRALDLIESAAAGNPADPRIDLEPERTRALLLKAEIQQAVSEGATAATSASEFLERFSHAPEEHPARTRAWQLIKATGESPAEAAR